MSDYINSTNVIVWPHPIDKKLIYIYNKYERNYFNLVSKEGREFMENNLKANLVGGKKYNKSKSKFSKKNKKIKSKFSKKYKKIKI
jgi:hypothetical protein